MVSQAPNLKAIVNEDGAVILDIDHDLMSTLNPTGAYVWQGLQRGETVGLGGSRRRQALRAGRLVRLDRSQYLGPSRLRS